MSEEFESQDRLSEQLLLDEIRAIVRVGWFKFRARNFPRMSELCPPEDGDLSPETPIQRRLLELIDPQPRREDGALLDREPLSARSRDDDGLFGRILFGEVADVVLPIGPKGIDLNVDVREMRLGDRQEVLAKLRHCSASTIAKVPKEGEPQGGLAYRCCLDVRDRLLIGEDVQSAARAVPASAPQTADVSPVDSGGWRSGSEFLHTLLTRRRLVTAALVVSVAVLVAVTFTYFDSGETDAANGLDGRSFKPASVTETSGFGAGMEVKNLDFYPHWGSKVEADSEDKLKFAVWLANRSAIATRELNIWLQSKSASGPNGNIKRSRAIVSDVSTGQTYVTSPWVEISDENGRMEKFNLSTTKATVEGTSHDNVQASFFRQDGSRLGASLSRGGSAQLPYVDGAFPDPTSTTEEIDGPIDIGSLDPSQQVSVVFEGSWQVRMMTNFGRLPPAFKTIKPTVGKWLETGAAVPGQRLHFAIRLDNQSTYAAPARIRVRVRRGAGGKVIRVQSLGRLYEDDEARLGEATVSSGDNRPIDLVPVPGSTYGLRFKNPKKCKISTDVVERIRTDFPDGITLGGIDIGSFGGYTPHSKCAGVEYNQWVYFDADVVRRTPST